MKKIKPKEKVAMVKLYKAKEGLVVTIIPLLGKKRKFNKLISNFEIGFIEKKAKITRGVKEIKNCELLEISLVKRNSIIKNKTGKTKENHIKQKCNHQKRDNAIFKCGGAIFPIIV